MSADLLDEIIAAVRDAIPEHHVVDVGGAYQDDGIAAGTVVVAVEYGSTDTHPGLTTVRARLDVWERGPSTSEADATAQTIIEALDGAALSSDRQMWCWLVMDSKTADGSESDLARVTVQLTGRAIRARWDSSGG